MMTDDGPETAEHAQPVQDLDPGGLAKVGEAPQRMENTVKAAQSDPPRATVGRIVHFVMPDGRHRPAIVVEEFGGGTVNLQVFTDGANDGHGEGMLWKTSVGQDDETTRPGSWHWPERG
jgi:hypothetical protein